MCLYILADYIDINCVLILQIITSDIYSKLYYTAHCIIILPTPSQCNTVCISFVHQTPISVNFSNARSSLRYLVSQYERGGILKLSHVGEHRVHHGLLVLELPVHVRETLYPDDVSWIRYHRLRNCGGVLPTAVSHSAPGQSTIINRSTKIP